MGDEKAEDTENVNIDLSLVPNEYRYLLSEDSHQIISTNEKQVPARNNTSQRTKSTRTKSTLELNSSYDIEFKHNASIAQILHDYQTSTVYSRRRLLETNVPLLQDSVRAYHEKMANQKSVKPDKTTATAATHRR
ncbi:hypothetical protein WDU94_001603 [Cyamophila willieti]